MAAADGSERAAVRILFLARHFTYFRNFDSAIRLLASRGHSIHLAAEREEFLGGRALVDRLAAESPAITVGFTPERADARMFEAATALRLAADYFRYADRSYDDAPAIRARSRERTPRLALAFARLPGRGAAARLLRTAEGGVPLDPHVHAFLREAQPDVVLLTPLLELGSPQLDYLKSARALGIPTGLCVWSWDHLTSKSLIRVLPDRVFVWNETQRREAIELHGVPAERLVVTGAQCFDQWFDRPPSRDRPGFCRDAGLPDDAPFVLYVCSAPFRECPSEADFVRRWLSALRASSNPRLRALPVLVRPHPQRRAEWNGVDLSSLGPVSVWGATPLDSQARADYFDSLYHAATVVGLNTSALIEAAIVDRPVHTILLPEFATMQEGTHHFRYLVEGPTAFLRIARSMPEHLAQIAEAMEQPDTPQNRRFVEHFVRPSGVSVPATPVFADAVEELGAVHAAPVRPAWSPVAGTLVRITRAAVATEWGRTLLEDPVGARERRARQARLADKQTLVDARVRVRRQKEDDKRRRWRDKRRRDRIVRLKTALRRIVGGPKTRPT
jgi:hypothetical protein